MSIELLKQDAEHKIGLVDARATDLMMAIRYEEQAIRDRDEVLAKLIAGLVHETNPLTGKPHSATSAEAAAKLTDEYKAKQADRLTAECRRIGATTDLDMAKLRAQLAVAVVRGDAL